MSNLNRNKEGLKSVRFVEGQMVRLYYNYIDSISRYKKRFFVDFDNNGVLIFDPLLGYTLSFDLLYESKGIRVLCPTRYSPLWPARKCNLLYAVDNLAPILHLVGDDLCSFTIDTNEIFIRSVGETPGAATRKVVYLLKKNV